MLTQPRVNLPRAFSAPPKNVKNTKKIYIFAFGPRRHPKMAQYETSRWHLGVKMAQDCLKKAQDGPKMAPRRPNTAPRCPRKHRKTQGKSTFSLLDCLSTPRAIILGHLVVLMQSKSENVDFPYVFSCFWGVLGAPRPGGMREAIK